MRGSIMIQHSPRGGSAKFCLRVPIWKINFCFGVLEKFIYQIGTLKPHGINERFSFN